MSSKLFNFLSSFGVMLLGVILLFVGSVGFELKNNPQFLTFPKSRARAATGGDVTAPVLPSARPTVPLIKPGSEFNGALSAVSVVAMDDKSGTVLYDKNTLSLRPLASVTKLMSALVLLDLPLDWSTTTVISADDWDGSSHHINVGEEFKLDDLFNVALVGSVNSAINALVRVSGLSRPYFVELMNQKAAKLKLTSLKFTDPTGLDAGNAGTTKDLARLLGVALQREKIVQPLQTPEYYASPLGQPQKRRVWNTNWLLTHWIPSGYSALNIAGKTGYIAESDYNFVARLTNESGHSIRVVILGADSNESRFTEARDLADWVFSHYLWPDQDGYGELVES